MKIITLLENTTSSKYLKCKHGLSLYIETHNHKILFDLGPNEYFYENAKKLNINIKDIDIVVLSHGHKDHGGGLEYFLKHNNTAKIYIHSDAFNSYHSLLLGALKPYIGLDNSLKNHPQIILTEGINKIDDELVLYSNINNTKLLPTGNKSLLEKMDDIYIKDNFNHEQNLIIKESDRNILFAGCAHKGILNIIEEGKKLINNDFDSVVSGFHLHNPITKENEDKNFIYNLAAHLDSYNSTYYTLHCTGEYAYNLLKEDLGDKINYLSTGTILEI